MLQKSSIFSILSCWMLFFVLHFILFIPSYALNSEFITGNPGLTEAGWWRVLWSGHPNRLLRYCGDFLLLLLPVLLIPSRPDWIRKMYGSLVSLLYLALLYYNIYFEGYQVLYSVSPVFENDWVIVREILPTFLREVAVPGSTYGWITAGFLLGSFLLFLLVKEFQKKLTLWKESRNFWLMGLVLFFLYGALQQLNSSKIAVEVADTFGRVGIVDTVHTYRIDSVYLSPVDWVYPRIRTSATLHREDHMGHLKKHWLYDFYKNKTLLTKPNVYLIFVESYGGVATLSDYCAPLYDTLSRQLYSELQAHGWSVASNYSKSTVIGGRSWLAMTTALIGARIEDQLQYNALLKNEKGYPHMVDFFNQNDYETYRVSTMRIGKIDTLNMITIPNEFWNFDQRYFFPDIPYKGYQYDYYGGIPDQYTLGYVEEVLLKDSLKPHFLTLITMNSHGPFQSKMPPITADWRRLNELDQPFGDTLVTANMKIFNYWVAIDYQLKMISNFIINQGKDNSLYIIMGDHNPGGLEYKLYQRFNKWATPIHIISKDAGFVRSFHQHGFTEGIKVDTSSFTIMRHMGLYSLLTRQLVENYGEEGAVLPDYLPWGLR